MKELSFVTEVDSRGRITIPQTIRTLLDLKDRDFVKISNVQKVSKETEALTFEEHKKRALTRKQKAAEG